MQLHDVTFIEFIYIYIYVILRNFTAVASSLKSMIINVYVKLRNSAAPTYCPVVVIVVEVIVWVSGRQYLSSSAQKPSVNHQNPTIDPTIAGLFGETQGFIKCLTFLWRFSELSFKITPSFTWNLQRREPAMVGVLRCSKNVTTAEELVTDCPCLNFGGNVLHSFDNHPGLNH